MDIGHSQTTYVIWINSMYYGYEGWINSDTTSIPQTNAKITSIGYNCFSGCSNLENNFSEICNGKNLSYIGEYAFDGCSNMKGKVELGPNLKTIEYATFRWCTGITELEIIDCEKEKYINDMAFMGCSGLEKIKMPISVEYNYNSSNYGSFSACTGIKELEFTKGTGKVFDGSPYIYNWGSDVSIIGASKEKLKKVTFEDGIREIYPGAFKDCINLEIAIIPKSIERIGYEAFSNCTQLSLDNYFNETNNGLHTIESYAFSGCTNIKGKIVLGGRLNNISDGIFCYCTGITELEIKDNVTSISYSAFSGCTGIKKIKIPISTTYEKYSYSSFGNCTGIKELQFTKGNGNVFNGSTDDISRTNDVSVIGASKDMLEKVSFEDGIKEIYQYAFKDCTNLKTVTIPKSVEKIGCEAFLNCKQLSLDDYFNETNNNLATIESNAFTDCTNITGKVVLGGRLNNIDWGSFSGCTGITELEIKDNVENISGLAFCGCTGIKKIKMPISATYNTTNSYCSFVDCTGIKELEFTKGTGEIFNGSKYDTYWTNDMSVIGYSKRTLEKVIFEDGIKEIYQYAFKDCGNLKTVAIPKTVEKIGEKAFSDCIQLSLDNYFNENNNSLTTIEYCAFEGCPNITGKVVLGGRLNNIEWSIFNGCTGITELEIKDNVANISGSAFSGCTGLKKIKMPISTTYEKGSYSSFSNCTGIKELQFTRGTGEVFDGAIYYNSDYGDNNASVIGDSRDKLEKVTFEEGIVSIYPSAFKNCTNLTTAIIPRSVKQIGGYAFNNCPNLTIYGYKNTYAQSYATTFDINFVDLDEQQKEPILGDINGDGKITLVDYAKILAHVKKTNLITDEKALKAADVNCDGKITLADYAKVLAHVKKTTLLQQGI